jgi:hypothetical protein
LKGNEAQGSIGRRADGNIGERQRTLEQSKALRSRARELETAGWNNGEKETIVVTQFSCFGGEDFGGYEVRAWERRGGLDIVETRRTGGHTGNSSNPTAGSRVQQTCTAACGVNRRSREERQGRKACCAWQRSAEGHPSFGRRRLGQDAGCLCRWRGVLWKTTREEVRTEESEHQEVFGRSDGKTTRKNRTVQIESLKARRRTEGCVPAVY